MEELRRVSIPNELLLPQICELVQQGHNVTIRVRGNSMNPFFVDRRDEVILSPFTKEDIRVGAVVLAVDERERFVLHRIIRIEGDDIVLMGDGNWKGVEHSSPERIKGKVTGAVRNGKLMKCHGFGWELMSWAWSVLRPLRRWLLAIWRRL